MFGKLRPLRQPELTDHEPIADLDSIISVPKSFKLFGRWRAIKPVSTEEFFRYTHAVNRVFSLREEKTSKAEERAEQIRIACFDVFRSVCDDITQAEVDKMALVQVVALFGHITDAVTGSVRKPEAEQDLEKKKSQNG